MTWFRIDDTFAFHRKTVMAGNAAVGLWVRAGAWSAQQLNDGYIPDYVAATLGTEAQADRLVKAELWECAPGGYRFWQWDERQPSRAAVEKRRADWRDRQRKAREKGDT